MANKKMEKKVKKTKQTIPLTDEARDILASMRRVGLTRIKRPIFYLPTSSYVRVI
jgi:hypothetical protein